MLETYILEHLTAVAKYGTFSRAAEELHTSQPAVTRSMKKIEDELGVSLFNRTKNAVTLNELGELAARYAQSIIDLQQNMTDAIHAADKKRHTFSFASCAPAPIIELTPMVAQLYVGLSVSSELLDDEAMWRGLNDGSFEFICTREAPDDDGLVSVPLMRERLSVLVSKDHRLAKRESVALSELANETFLLDSNVGFWLDLCEKNIPNASFIKQEKREDLYAIVDSSNLPSFATNISERWRTLPTGKVAVPISDECVDVTYHFVCKKENERRLFPLISELKSFYKGTTRL